MTLKDELRYRGIAGVPGIFVCVLLATLFTAVWPVKTARWKGLAFHEARAGVDRILNTGDVMGAIHCASDRTGWCKTRENALAVMEPVLPIWDSLHKSLTVQSGSQKLSPN